jgi:hypothetical protein
VTLAELEGIWNWRRLHPEFRRRLWALFEGAWRAGTAVGHGGGARSYAQQLANYQRDPNTFAPAGLSWHEDNAYQGQWAAAADLIGNLTWANANAANYGLNHFANVNSEPWHHQPKPLPNARRNYVPSLHVLNTWPLPFITPPAPAPAPTPTPAPAPVKEITVDLPFELLSVATHQNVVSQWTKNAQSLLNGRAGTTVVEVDGRYGPKTEAIVRLVQTEEKITVDGKFGPQTLRAIWDGRG